MSTNDAAFSSFAGKPPVVRSALAGTGGALAAGTAKAASILAVGKGMAVGAGLLAGGPLGAAIAVGLMTSMIYGSAAARRLRD